jgi:hypothetical protein
MYTGDPLQGMEIIIQVGDLKMHHGVIIQTTLKKEGAVAIVVETTTRSVNTRITLDLTMVAEAAYRGFILH